MIDFPLLPLLNLNASDSQRKNMKKDISNEVYEILLILQPFWGLLYSLQNVARSKEETRK